MEIAGNIADESRKKRIVPRHIMLAINNDDELSKIVGNCIFHESGVVPHIEPVLLMKKKGDKKGS